MPAACVDGDGDGGGDDDVPFSARAGAQVSPLLVPKSTLPRENRPFFGALQKPRNSAKNEALKMATKSFFPPAWHHLLGCLDGDGPMMGCAVATVLTKKGHT
jgi:hypothetical protein